MEHNRSNTQPVWHHLCNLQIFAFNANAHGRVPGMKSRAQHQNTRMAATKQLCLLCWKRLRQQKQSRWVSRKAGGERFEYRPPPGCHRLATLSTNSRNLLSISAAFTIPTRGIYTKTQSKYTRAWGQPELGMLLGKRYLPESPDKPDKPPSTTTTTPVSRRAMGHVYNVPNVPS